MAMSAEKLVEHFSALADPRCAGKVEHRLTDILVIAVCAVIACAESWDRHRALRPQQAGLAAILLDPGQWRSLARHLPAGLHADRPGCLRDAMGRTVGRCHHRRWKQRRWSVPWHSSSTT